MRKLLAPLPLCRLLASDSHTVAPHRSRCAWSCRSRRAAPPTSSRASCNRSSRSSSASRWSLRTRAAPAIVAADVAQATPDGYTILLVFDTHAVNHHIYKMAPDPFTRLEHHAHGVFAEHARPVSRRTICANSSRARGHKPAHLRDRRRGELEPPRRATSEERGHQDDARALQGRRADDPGAARQPDRHRVRLDSAHPSADQGQGESDRGRRQVAHGTADVPTLAETYPGLEQVSWFGLLTPTGAARDCRQIAPRDGAHAASAEVRERLQERGFDVVASRRKNSRASCALNPTSSASSSAPTQSPSEPAFVQAACRCAWCSAPARSPSFW